jgi:hypothetical protein
MREAWLSLDGGQEGIYPMILEVDVNQASSECSLGTHGSSRSSLPRVSSTKHVIQNMSYALNDVQSYLVLGEHTCPCSPNARAIG